MSEHKFKGHNTAYGVIYWCEYCKVTDVELKSLSAEEVEKLELYCKEQQQKQADFE